MIVRAIWEFDVDDSEMSEEWVDVQGLCEELTQREVDYLLRIKDGNYIAIFHDRMIEVKADSKKDAYNKAKRYFESREHRELFDGELKVCQIPSMIGVLDE